jgi:hypothetical protein
MASLGEEIEASYGRRGVKVTSTMGETDVVRNFKVKHYSYLMRWGGG